MAAATPEQEIRSYLNRTNGGFGRDRNATTCYAVVFEAGQWHVLLNARTTDGAQAAIDQWAKRTRGRTAVIVNAADVHTN